PGCSHEYGQTRPTRIAAYLAVFRCVSGGAAASASLFPPGTTVPCGSSGGPRRAPRGPAGIKGRLREIGGPESLQHVPVLGSSRYALRIGVGELLRHYRDLRPVYTLARHPNLILETARPPF